MAIRTCQAAARAILKASGSASRGTAAEEAAELPVKAVGQGKSRSERPSPDTSKVVVNRPSGGAAGEQCDAARVVLVHDDAAVCGEHRGRPLRSMDLTRVPELRTLGKKPLRRADEHVGRHA